MECHVPRANLRAFSNALLTLGKIGKEVFFETTAEEVGGHVCGVSWRIRASSLLPRRLTAAMYCAGVRVVGSLCFGR